MDPTEQILKSFSGFRCPSLRLTRPTAAIILSMKLGEVELLKEHLSAAPILLLDDVSSELDVRRTNQLFELISSVGGQFLLRQPVQQTTRRPEDQRFQVEEGQVSEVTE